MKTEPSTPHNQKRRSTQSDIRSMSEACERLGGINMAQGVCDLAPPKIVLEAAKSAIDEGKNQYSKCDGVQILREAIAYKTQRDQNISYDPQTEVVVSAGATGALFCAAMALLKPGDEVIVFAPFYEYHIKTLETLGIVPKVISLHGTESSFDLSDLENSFTHKTRAIVVNTPINPSGKIFNIDELKILSDFVIKNNLYLFTDEIYEYFVYDGKKHISPASMPGMKERTVLISGYSKTFSVTGWRIGYALAPKELISKISAFNDLYYVCAPTPLQLGVAEGINKLDLNFYQQINRTYQNKRDLICEALGEAGLTPLIPSGAYYVLANVENVPGADSHQKALWLLEKSGLAAVPGRAFYPAGMGEHLLRFCFAKPFPVLGEALKKLKALRAML